MVILTLKVLGVLLIIIIGCYIDVHTRRVSRGYHKRNKKRQGKK